MNRQNAKSVILWGRAITPHPVKNTDIAAFMGMPRIIEARPGDFVPLLNTVILVDEKPIASRISCSGLVDVFPLQLILDAMGFGDEGPGEEDGPWAAGWAQRSGTQKPDVKFVEEHSGEVETACSTASAPDILKSAADTLAERGKQYDKPEGERSMGQAVAAFNTITGEKLRESHGWLLLQLLKDVRDNQREAPHEDSLLDCVSYSALKAEARLAGR